MAHQLYKYVIHDDPRWYEQCAGIRNALLQKVRPFGTNTILHIAIEYKRSQIVREVLEIFNTYEYDHEGAKVLLAKLLLQKQNSDGDTALHVAARVGCLKIIEILIRADRWQITTMRNLEGDTVLHIAVRYGDLDVVKFLLEKNSELATQQNKANESVLFLAIERGYIEIAKHLLRERRNCAYGGREGMNALHSAIVWKGTKYSNQPHMRQRISNILRDICLLDPSIVSEKDNILKWTPLHYAAYYDVNVFLALKMHKLGTNNTALEVDKNGMSALHIAAANGNTWILVELIEEFPWLYKVLNKHDQTALHVAIESEQKSSVHILLDHGNSEIFLNKQDKDGNTALHLAGNWGETEILRRLLNNEKVKGNIVNKKGLTIFDILIKQGATYDDSMFLMFKSWMKLPIPHQPSIMSMLRERKNEIWGLKGQVAQIEAEIQLFEQSQDEKQKVDQDKKSDLVANRLDPVRKREEVRRNNYKAIISKKSSYLLWEFGKSILDMLSIKTVKKATENDTLIATIIATVTFAVAFQVPGGYESEGQHKGLPILRSRYSFMVFIISNSMAFGFSSCSILLHFLAAKGQSPQDSDRLLHHGMALTFYSMLTMVVAFISAIQLISTNSKALQAAPYICAISFIFFVHYDTLLHRLHQLSGLCLHFGIMVLSIGAILLLSCLVAFNCYS